MKKRKDYFRVKKMQEISEIGYSDYEELFQEGYTDEEISRDLGVDEEFVKKLREEYQNDY